MLSAFKKKYSQETSKKICTITPVANRLDRILNFLEGLSSLKRIDEIEIYLAADKNNDTEESVIEKFPGINFFRSEHNSHLHTLNSAVKNLSVQYDYLIYLNDDMFPEEDFLGKTIEAINKYEEKYQDQIFSFYFRDGHQNEKLSTTFCISKNYIMLLGGKIYQDDYFHGYFADEEFYNAGKKIKRLNYEKNIFVRHDHFELKDSHNQDTESSFWNLDKKIYECRKKHNFNIEELKFRIKYFNRIKY